MSTCFSLVELGWQPFFQQQLSMEEWDAATPARVVEQHKSEMEVATQAGTQQHGAHYSKCRHGNEPGCAVRTAIESGDLEERRLLNYLKLSREQALNSASLAQRRARPIS